MDGSKRVERRSCRYSAVERGARGHKGGLAVGAVVAGLMVLVLLLAGCDSDDSADVVTQGDPAGGQQLVDTVTVVGMAKVTASPDEAVISVSVETGGGTPAEALDSNSQQAQQIVDRLKAVGVSDEAIATENVSVYPVRTYNPETGEESLSGYRAQNTVTVTLSDTATVGTVLAAAVEAGGTNVAGPEWRLADDSAVIRQALEEATADARQKAEALAAAAGVGLGDVLMLSESGATTPPVVYEDTRAMAADTAVAIPPVSPKDLEVTASVTATYRLKR